MIPKDGLTLQYLLVVLRRRFWYVVLPFFLLSIAAVLYCIRAPKIYKSSALVLIQPQEVPADYVKSTVTTDVQSRLSSITEQVLSRSRLEKIVEKHNLYPRVRATATMYDAVEKMRKQVQIEVKKDKISRRWGAAPTAFEVSFEGREPIKARDVTTAIANLFIDYNFRLRAEQAAGTSKFLERELKRIREDLRQKEELVRQFKEQYKGLLPEQMENNHRIMAQLQLHLDSMNTSLQQVEDRKVLLQSQLNKLETLRIDGLGNRAVGSGVDRNQLPLSIEELRQQLKSLKSRYSDGHPDVRKVAATIAKLEREEVSDSSATEPQEPDNLTDSQRILRFQREDLLTQLKLLDEDTQDLKQQISETGEQVEGYRLRIEDGPRIEQMFVDLRRDYERANDNYQSLLQKKLQADLAENLERTQKGEQFTLLDSANLPQEPFKPDIPKILLIGLMIGCAGGCGLALFREYLDGAFWTRIDVESVLEVPVLVSVPIIQLARDRRWNMVKLAGSVCALLIMSSALLYALFVLWQKNPTLLSLAMG